MRDNKMLIVDIPNVKDSYYFFIKNDVEINNLKDNSN